MKKIRLFAALIFFAAAMPLNSFAYEVLCQSAPTSTTVNATLKPIFTCAIPANAVATGKALRVTTNLHQTGTGTGSLSSVITLNGSLVISNTVKGEGGALNWSFIVTNAGGTACTVAGTATTGGAGITFAFGPGQTGTVTVPWSSGWTLEIEADSTSGTIPVAGDTFVVEIID
jgi:hypothetical protein